MDITFYLKGLDCANCAAKIENAVNDCDFSKKATLNYVAQKLTVTTDYDNIAIAFENSSTYSIQSFIEFNERWYR